LRDNLKKVLGLCLEEHTGEIEALQL
jgi:hypothetical protein